MAKWQKNLLFVFYLLAGIIFGALIASLCKNVSVLSWLSYYQSIGFGVDNPFVLDLSIMRLTLGFSMGIYVAQIFTIAIAIFAYNRTRIK